MFSDIPEIKVPTSTITVTIVVLVIIPLGIGMLFRHFNEVLAKRLIPVFSIPGVVALLIQDSMGDFHSSMFWVSGMFGLTMYLAGLIAIKVYPKILPVNEKSE
jgi:predicted Na+-dependent transporter